MSRRKVKITRTEQGVSRQARVLAGARQRGAYTLFIYEYTQAHAKAVSKQLSRRLRVAAEAATRAVKRDVCEARAGTGLGRLLALRKSTGLHEVKGVMRWASVG